MFTPTFTDGVWYTTFNSDLKDYCDKFRMYDTGRVMSNDGGYQSNNLNLEEPKLQPLISHILQETSNFKSLHGMKTKSKIISMWINISGYKDYNKEHHHSDCSFSGVYYIHTPHNCGNIEFIRHDRDRAIRLSEFNNINSASWWLLSQKHTCYIFPSYYLHRVNPNLNKEEERYSISFNIQ